VKSKHIIFLVITILILTASAVAAYRSSTITNSDPIMNSDKLTLKDYKHDRSAKIAYFRKNFPIGTPKEVVDQVLTREFGTKTMEINEIPDGLSAWRYDEPHTPGYPGGPAHTFIFDSNNRLLNINFSLTEYLYGDEITTGILIKKYNDRKGE
jgi:hypothetical protein